jgi:hypothetical protein
MCSSDASSRHYSGVIKMSEVKEDSVEKSGQPKIPKENGLILHWRTVWLGIGFTFLPFFALVLGFLNVHPEIWRSLPAKMVHEQSFPETDIAWSDADKKNPPLKYVRDKFTFVSIETEIPLVNNFWSLFSTPSSTVNWTWEYVVKNLTKNQRTISVSYYLVDDNGSRIAEAGTETITAEPDETVTLEGNGTIPYGLLGSVSQGSWGIR